MFYFYFIRCAFRRELGRWWYWRDVPDKYVRLAGTVYFRMYRDQFEDEDAAKVREILLSARQEWKLRKRHLLLMKKPV